MELQKYIDDNKEYLNQFKEHKLYVRKYSTLGLCIFNVDQRGASTRYWLNVERHHALVACSHDRLLTFNRILLLIKSFPLSLER